MRVVFVTNVSLSAALFKGSKPDRAFEKAKRIGDIIRSTKVTDELISVIFRPTSDKYLQLRDKLAFLVRYFEESELIKANIEINICRDPKDDKYLELDVTGVADCIVTGDSDLLVLHPSCPP